MKYYFLHIQGGIEGEVHGPFFTRVDRDMATKEYHNDYRFGDEDAILWMDVNAEAHAQVEVGSYTGGFFGD